MRHFLALALSIGALAGRVEDGAPQAALVAPPGLTHALAACIASARSVEAIRVAPVAAAADLHQRAAASAGVDPVLGRGVHSRSGLPRHGQPNPFKTYSHSGLGAYPDHTSGSEARGASRAFVYPRGDAAIQRRTTPTPIATQPPDQRPPVALTAPSGPWSQARQLHFSAATLSGDPTRYSSEKRGSQPPFTPVSARTARTAGILARAAGSCARS